MWFKQKVMNTKKKYIILLGHHTLSGITSNGLLCYGKGGAEIIERGNNLKELIQPLLLSKAKPVIFLGHDHIFVSENYKGIEIVHCPSWTKSRQDNWRWHEQGYKNAEIVCDGCFFYGTDNGEDTIWEGTIQSIRQIDGGYRIEYDKDFHESFLPDPDSKRFPKRYKYLSNSTKKSTAIIINIDISKNIIDVVEHDDQSSPLHKWQSDDKIMFACAKPGYVVLEVKSGLLTYYMKDKFGKEVKGTRRTVHPKK
jgi:hypothetical protein